MENVQGLARHASFAHFIETLSTLDYDVNYGVVSCERVGVPQRRRRLVLVASRLRSVSLPEENATPPSVGDFIRDLPAIGDGDTCAHDAAHTTLPLIPINRQRIAQSKPGGSWSDWDDHLINNCHKKTHYPAPYGRMSWDGLAPTITTQFCYYSTGRFGHPGSEPGDFYTGRRFASDVSLRLPSCRSRESADRSGTGAARRQRRARAAGQGDRKRFFGVL